MIVCPKCRYQNDIQAKLCNQCGELFQTSKTNTTPKNPSVLICNAFESIAVVPNHQYTLGRGKDNSIVLNSDLVSRFHSLITVDPNGTVFIEDRGSRNGTLLNGIKIQAPQVVKLGDKITVGSFHIFYQEIEKVPSKEEFNDEITMPVSEIHSMDGMFGDLSAHMTIPELFTTLQFNEKTGVLSITSKEKEGKVFFRQGEVIRCTFKNLTNLEAVGKVLGMREGVFEFVPQDLANMPREITLSTVQLLLQYTKNFDEANKKK